MILEHQIVPYETSPLPPGPWLVLAPHPDDETFGMGGSLLRAKEEGIETAVLVMTDGALGGSGPGLAKQREEEAREAACFLGLSRIDFLGLPDREVQCTDEVAERLAALIAGAAPATLFFPGVMELHPDHRATAELAWRALARLRNEAIRPVSYEISVQGPVNLLVDITSSMEAKRQALQIYRSQLAENDYIGIITALNKARTFTLPPEVRFAEGFHLYDPSAPFSGKTLRDLTLERLSQLFAPGASS